MIMANVTYLILILKFSKKKVFFVHVNKSINRVLDVLEFAEELPKSNKKFYAPYKLNRKCLTNNSCEVDENVSQVSF